MQVLFSNQFFVAVNKPPGIAVHGAPGPGRSLLEELSEQLHAPNLTPVHRLDKDASGVLLFARNADAAGALQNHWSQTEKEYWALSEGVPNPNEGEIDAPILEHSTGKPERLEGAVRYFKTQNPNIELPPLPAPKTSAVHPAGRTSQTRYAVRESFRGKWAALSVQPKQGRMHQIRVHLAHIECALAVDKQYGKREQLTARDVGGDSDEVLLGRMPLHARCLKIPAIPFVTSALRIEAPLPADLLRVLDVLRKL